jgi:peptidoglycan/LPS O-acetylase OafA/YrhL
MPASLVFEFQIDACSLFSKAKPIRHSAPSRAHIPALDGIRGIAILLVFAYHYGAGGIHDGSRWIRVLATICGFGWSGVDLFFVLSGFLITGILYDTRWDPGYYKKFYARRALRIFPVYYLFAAIVFVIGHGWRPGHLSFLLYVGYPIAFIWPSLVQIPLHITHLWSLQLEEQFYMMWPWVVKRLGTALKACLIAIVTAPLLRLLTLRLLTVFGNHQDWAYAFLPCRMDSLAVGAAIALLIRAGWKRRLDRWAPLSLVASSAALAAIFLLRHTTSHSDPVVTTVGFSLTALAYGALLVLALAHRKLFSQAALRLFGRYSYGLYLFHFPLTTLFEPLKHRLSVFYVPFCLLVNLAVAAASFHFFEQPILRLKNKKAFSYSPRDPIDAGLVMADPMVRHTASAATVSARNSAAGDSGLDRERHAVTHGS